jgi:hypothetical protein
MGDAVGQVLSQAVGVAISPVPLIAVVLMLATARGRANGIGFALGWVVTIAGVGAVVLVLGSGGDARQGGATADWVFVVKLVFGVVFLLLAGGQWRGRPKAGEAAELPGWMKRIDDFSPVKSAGLAVVLAGANPKNLVLIVGAAIGIAGSSGSGGDKAVALAVFVVIASLCATVPLAVYVFGGAKAARTLDGWKTWMAAHNSAIMTVLLLVLGAKYVGDAISGLSA